MKTRTKTLIMGLVALLTVTAALWLLPAQGVRAETITVTETFPPANVHTATVTSPVIVTYTVALTETLNAATVNTQTFAIHAMQTGQLTQTYSVNGGAMALTPDDAFFPGELVQASATTGTQSLFGSSPVSPTVWQFRTAVIASSGIYSGNILSTLSSLGVDMGDVDGDGDLDVFLSINGANRVWRNDGSGGFSDSGQTLGSSTSYGVALGDVDGDGDLDAFVPNYSSASNKVWLNDGNGTFSDSGNNLGSYSSYSVALGDVDGDGDLDAFVTNLGNPDKVYLNDGDGSFSDSGQTLGSSDGNGVALGDVDGDGDLDAFVANRNSQANKVWLNDGGGTFSDSGQSLGGSTSFSVFLGDVDGDSDLDAFVGNSNQANKVWLNDGSGTFSDSGHSLGSADSRSVILGDVDGDGDLDAFVGNYGPANKVYLNDGSGTFSDSGQSLGSSNTYGAALGDGDGDGDLDAFAANQSDAHRVWLNQDPPDVGITKAVEPTSAVPGAVITYTFTFSNAGDLTATGVVINDSIPVSVTVTGIVSTGIAITQTSGAPNWTWAVEDLAPGAGGVITITGVLSDPLALGIFTNTVIITTTRDSNPNNNESSAGVTVTTLCNIQTEISVAECQALLALYNSTHGDNWSNNKNWLDRLPCSWYGVSCSGGHVSSLNVYSNNLSGTLPSELGNLTYVTYFDVDGNSNLTGPIPPELGDMSSVQYMGLHYCNLTGPIPVELTGISSLRTLRLYNNNLTGTIPSELGSMPNLEQLGLGYNALTGTIPVALGNAITLTDLRLSSNNLSGSIPPQLGNLTNLANLLLDSNNLTGTIPVSLTNLNQVGWLNLGYNELTGPIPPEISNMTQLYYLTLSDNNLSGPIPAELGELNLMRYMYLGSNQFTGTIPISLTELSLLEQLTLSANELTGTLPSELGNLTNLTRLFLNDNHFTGSIPQELGNLSQLTRLILRSNQLTGSIPVSITNLVNLDNTWGLDIGQNGVWANDSTLRAFLSQKDADWENTQTIPPVVGGATALGETEIQVNWTPITYTADGGYYQVGYALQSGGPYMAASTTTANKYADHYTVTGLEPATPYYFVVNTYTPAGSWNQNPITSPLSNEGMATTLARPQFTSTPVTTATEDVVYAYNITATDVDVSDPLTITAPTLPTWLTLTQTMSISGTAMADLAGTPDASDVGTHTVSLLVTDTDGLTDTQSFGIIVSAAPSQPPVVQSVSPPANALMVPVTTDVSATYDQDMDAATVNAQTFAVYGVQSGWMSGAYHVDSNTIILTPAQPFKVGECMQASVTTGTLSLAGMAPLTPTVWQFRTAVSAGSGMFVDTGQTLESMDTMDVRLGDVDGDGDLDVLSGNGGAYGHTKIWLNDGSGTLTDSGQDLLSTQQAVFGDFDSDGDPDVVIGRFGVVDEIWLNDGTGVYTVTGTMGNPGRTYGLDVGDVDGDGDLDVAAAVEGANVIYLNDGNANFTVGSSLGGGESDEVRLGDLDGDGDLDAIIGLWNVPSLIYMNDGQGNFTDSGNTMGGSQYMFELGDLDGDGDLDALVGNRFGGLEGSAVWFNDGTGVFTDSGQTLGTGEGWIPDVGDVDGDGDLDAIASNKTGANVVWINDGTGVFTSNGQVMVSDATQIVRLGDLNGDGALDAFIGNNGANRVWLNDVTAPNTAPSFNSTPVLNATEDVAYVYYPTAQDADVGDVLTLTAPVLPSWLTLTQTAMVSGTVMGELAGTPGASDVGTHPVSLLVADSGGLTDTQDFVINVASSGLVYGLALEPAEAAQSSAPGTTLTYTLYLTNTGNVSDVFTLVASGNAWSIALSSFVPLPPASASVVHVAVDIPAGAADGASDVATITATSQGDAGQSATSVLTTTAVIANNAPSFTSTPVTTATEEAVYAYAILADDPDGDALTINATTLPAWLTLHDNGNGTASLSGAPDDPEVGTHAVTLQVMDIAGATDTQTFNITVMNVNDAPQFTSTPVTTGTVDAPYSYAITVSDADVGDTAVISATTLPAWLTLTTPPTGTAVLAGTPSAADAGEHGVSLLVMDGAGATAAQNFTILVLGSGPLVLNANDDGVGSLRQIIANTAAGETVTFDPSLSGATITLASLIVVDKDLTIHTDAPITVSGGGTVAIFVVNSGADVSINGLTLAEGSSIAGSAVNVEDATLTLNDCTVRDHASTFGAIYLNGGSALTINRCTFLDNEAQAIGAAVVSNQQDAVSINNSTFVNNRAGQQGGAIFALGPLTLTHATFSGNASNVGAAHVEARAQLNVRNTIMTGGSGAYQCFAQTLVESTGNIINGYSTCGGTEADPQLDALADNGGATWTQAVTWGSPAINAADSAYCLPTDQRGQTRPQDGACDAGAYEAILNNKAPSFTSIPVAEAEQDSEYRYTVTALDPNAQDVLAFSGPVRPDWLGLQDNGDGTAALVGTPGVPAIGVHSVTLAVADGLGVSATQHFSISVAPRPPVTLTVVLTGNGSGSVTSMPAGMPAGIDCGTTCAARFDCGSTVRLTAQPETGSVFAGWDNCDAPAANECTVTANAAKMVGARFVVQNNDNYPPTALNDSAQTTSGETVVIHVLNNDWDADGLDTGSVVIVTAPASGTVTVNSDGSVRYTPNADFKGAESFNYTVNDTQGAMSNAATVDVEVAGANDTTVPKAMVFYMVAGMPPEAQRLTVQGIQRNLSWSYTSWLERVNKQWGPRKSDGWTYLIDFSVESTLGVGTHYGTIKVWRDGATSVPVPVTVIVTEQPELMLSKTRLGFTGVQNHVTPPTQTIKLSHAGATPFNWTARANAAWVVLTPANGTTPGDLQVAIDPAKMADVGEHTAKVFVNNGVQDHEINVTLNVVAPDSEPLALTGLEVNQVIQNLNNDIALVANKTTIVRAHIQSRVGGTVGNVTAKLYGYRDGLLLGTLSPSSDGGAVNVPTEPDRANLDDSFYFELPPAWTTGEVTLVFSGENQAVACQESVGTPEDCAVTVSFQPMPALPIKLIDVELNLDGEIYKPDQHDRDVTIRDFIALYPISEVDVSYGLPLKYTSSDNAQVLYDTRDVRRAAGDNDTLYASLIGKRVGGIAFRPGLDSVSSVDTLLPHKYTEAHEVGHNLGFLHVAACADPAHIDPDYPHPDGRISGALVGNAAIYGLDTQYMRVLGPESKDTMTYCRYRWWSDYHYNQLLERVPSRFETRAARAPRGPLVARANEHVIMVSGIVTSAEAAGNIAAVLAITTSNDIAMPEPGNYTLRLETRDGTLLTEQSFSPDGFVDQDEGQAGEGFSLALPYFEDAARVVLRYGERTLTTREASLNRPTINVLAPNGGETVVDDRLIISWEASDEDDDTLSYIVEYSVDAGVTWETVAPAWPATNLVLDVADLPGSDQVLVQVAANDGFYTAWDHADAVFTINDNPPVATIRTPESDKFYVSGQQIILQGSGTDREDGALDGPSLTWYSDRHADPLGTGELLVLAAEDLAEGRHTIILVATDSRGQRSDAVQEATEATPESATEAASDKLSLHIYRDRPLIPAELAASVNEINLVTRLGSNRIVTKAFSVRNGGDGAPIAWEATVSGDLSVQLDVTAGTTPDTIVVSLDPASLSAAGTFTGVITLAPAATEDRAIAPTEILYAVDVNAPHAILNLTKAVEIGGGNEVSLGGVVTYTLVISNSGDAAATDIVITDLVPDALAYGAQLDTGTVIRPQPGNVLRWGPAYLPAQDAFSLVFTAIVTDTVAFAGQEVVNQATFTATNHTPGLSNQVTFTIAAAAPVNTPPTFTSTPIDIATVGVPYTYTVTASDSDAGDTLSLTATTLPAWLSLMDHRTGTGPAVTATLAGTPTVASDDRVVLHVSDGVSTTSQAFTITVSAAGDSTPPTFPAGDVLLAPADGTTVTQHPVVLRAATATDDVGVVQYDFQVVLSATVRAPLAAMVVYTSTNSSYTFTVDLPNGVYTWTVRAMDAAGNVSPWVTPWATFTVDVPTHIYMPLVVRHSS